MVLENDFLDKKGNNPDFEKSDLREDFDSKKILKPIAVLSLALILGSAALSFLIKGYSKNLLKKTDLIQPEDLARNMNIVEEPEFAMFRLLREPMGKNILGFLSVCLMSGIGLGAKNFVDGYKEVWINKQNCEINHNLQKNLIDIEVHAFSGKLDVVNDLLKNTTKYFKDTFSKTSFTGSNFKDDKHINKKEKDEEKFIDKIKKKLPLAVFAFLTTIFLSFLMFKNLQKAAGNFDFYQKKLEKKLLDFDKQEIFELPDKQKAIKRLKEVLIATKASDVVIKDDVQKIKGITQDEIKEFIDEMNGLNIYTNADKAIYGTSGKIQYYCYINDNRGHLYNWILNPDNKFNKYLFLAFTMMSSVSYVVKSAVDAVKKTTVARENSKAELNLKKKLSDVEIANFKAKKLSAINPLIADFKLKLEKGASKEELLILAQNILLEIKNGPPYVYA